jgi:hypothetical protein
MSRSKGFEKVDLVDGISVRVSKISNFTTDDVVFLHDEFLVIADSYNMRLVDVIDTNGEFSQWSVGCAKNIYIDGIYISDSEGLDSDLRDFIDSMDNYGWELPNSQSYYLYESNVNGELKTKFTIVFQKKLNENMRGFKYLKTYEKYEVPVRNQNMSNIFGISKEEVSFILSDMKDEFDFIEFKMVSDEDMKNISIEIFDPQKTDNFDGEYKYFKNNILDNLKQFLKNKSLTISKEFYNKERNRIIINIKKG